MKRELSFALWSITSGATSIAAAVILNFQLYGRNWETVSFRSKVAAVVAVIAILIGLTICILSFVRTAGNELAKRK